jgi:hypothetical protein
MNRDWLLFAGLALACGTVSGSPILDPNTSYCRTLNYESGTSGLSVRVIGKQEVGGISRLYGIRHNHFDPDPISAPNFLISTGIGSALAWTDTGAKATSGNSGLAELGDTGTIIQLVQACNRRFLVSDNGKLFRSSTNANDWTSWDEVSPAATYPGTTGRPDIFAASAQYIFYGNYNANFEDGAHVWRSGNCGNWWVEVFPHPETNLDPEIVGRHVHAIGVDPEHTKQVYLSVGDGGVGRGLYFSPSQGATAQLHPNFSQVASQSYGINFAFPPSAGAPRPLVLLEGDGPGAAHLYGYDKTLPGAASELEALVPPPITTGGGLPNCGMPPPSGTSGDWAGSGAGIAITGNGDAFYITSGEGGDIGLRDGVWLVAKPEFTTPVLLEELTEQITGWNYSKTFVTSWGELFNYNYRITVPRFINAP